MKKILGFVLVALITLSLPCTAQNRTKFGSSFASNGYAFGVDANTPPLIIDSNQTGTGSQTYTLRIGAISLSDGTVINPIFVNNSVRVGTGAAEEVVTITGASCGTPQIQDTCTFTASFVNAHGVGEIVASNTGGLYEAMNAAYKSGGGLAIIDPKTITYGLTTAQIVAAPVYPGVAIDDQRNFTETYWSPGPTASTALAVPTTLTAVTALASATPVGAYGTGTYYMCISYVDVMGNEGACSATFSQAGLATGSFIFSPPAASAGAVGYTIYISLTSGTYALAYQVPLTSTICTLTTVETITPACAVTNTNYNETGATATVTAITVNTSMLAINSAVIGTTTVVHGNAIAKTTYGYVPGSSLATSGIQGVYFPATGAAATSTNLDTVASIPIPANYMQVGRKLRVCGNATMSGASTATILGVDLLWDANVQDTAGAPVIISQNQLTPASALSASVLQYHFCQDIVATVTGTTTTGGTALAGDGFLSYSQTSAGTVGYGGPVTTVGTTGSLNFIQPARLHVAFVHTTGTDGAATVLQNLTVESL